MAANVVTILSTGGILATTAKLFAVGVVGSIAVDLLDFNVTNFLDGICGVSARIDSIQDIVSRPFATAAGESNVKSSLEVQLLSVISGTAGAIWEFVTGPVYAGLQQLGSRGFQCLEALEEFINNFGQKRVGSNIPEIGNPPRRPSIF